MSIIVIILFSISAILLLLLGILTKKHSKKVSARDNTPNEEEKMQVSDWYRDLEQEMIEKEKQENEKIKLLEAQEEHNQDNIDDTSIYSKFNKVYKKHNEAI